MFKKKPGKYFMVDLDDGNERDGDDEPLNSSSTKTEEGEKGSARTKRRKQDGTNDDKMEVCSRKMRRIGLFRWISLTFVGCSLQVDGESSQGSSVTNDNKLVVQASIHPRVRNFISLIFDQEMMKNTLKQLDVDIKYEHCLRLSLSIVF